MTCAFDGYYVHGDDFKRISRIIGDKGAGLINCSSSGFSVTTEAGSSIYVRLCGGPSMARTPATPTAPTAPTPNPTARTNNKKRKIEALDVKEDETDSDSDSDDAGALTQECRGLIQHVVGAVSITRCFNTIVHEVGRGY